MLKFNHGNTVVLRFSTEEIQRLFEGHTVSFPMSTVGGPEGMVIAMEHGGPHKEMMAAAYPEIKKDNRIIVGPGGRKRNGS